MWLDIAIPNWNRLYEKIQYGGELYEPWRKMLRKAGELVQERAKKRAPLGKRDSIAPTIKQELIGKLVPMYARVSFPNLTNNGFRYPGALEGGKKYHHRHRPGMVGKTTKGWFRGSLTGARRTIDKLMQNAAREIEQIWRR